MISFLDYFVIPSGQILNTNTEATVNQTQEKDKIIPAKGTVCQ
jgi:hypothetical protein